MRKTIEKISRNLDLIDGLRNRIAARKSFIAARKEVFPELDEKALNSIDTCKRGIARLNQYNRNLIIKLYENK